MICQSPLLLKILTCIFYRNSPLTASLYKESGRGHWSFLLVLVDTLSYATKINMWKKGEMLFEIYLESFHHPCQIEIIQFCMQESKCFIVGPCLENRHLKHSLPLRISWILVSFSLSLESHEYSWFLSSSLLSLQCCEITL